MKLTDVYVDYVLPLCERATFFAEGEVFDDCYSEPNHYQLTSCAACGHVVITLRLHESDPLNLYDTYYLRKSILGFRDGSCDGSSDQGIGCC